ncbi:MAG: class F sortase [Candidatus Saccharibacteria bacterium]
MEGAIARNVSLRSSGNKPVSQRDYSSIYIRPIFKPAKRENMVKQISRVVNHSPVISNNPVIDNTQKHYSKLTPVYKKSETNAAVIYPTPKISNIEFVNNTHSSKSNIINKETLLTPRQIATRVSDNKNILVEDKLDKAKPKKLKTKSIYRFALTVLLLFFIVLGGYVVVDSFLVNQRAKIVLAQSPQKSLAVETPVVVDSEPKPIEKSTDIEQKETPVAAPIISIPLDQPKNISIEKIGVDAAVISLGLASDGSIDTPKSAFDAGWYTGSSNPGSDGAAIIDGHSTASHGGVFGNIEKLASGDQIKVEMGNGTIINYKVVSVEIINRKDVDMSRIMKPYSGAIKGLNLISCTGDWIELEKTLENRVIVFAEQI